MIQRDTYLGFSLRTRSNRRTLVIAYYAFVLALTSVPMMLGRQAWPLLLPQTLVLGGLLGGIQSGGAVKPYHRSMLGRDPDESPVQQLGLDPATARLSESRRLDERETSERDRAHYLAYRGVHGLMVAAAMFGVALYGLNPAWLLHQALPLLWLFAVIVFSLPQSVILWTEPDAMAEGTLALV